MRALPKLAKAAAAEDLITAFHEHLEVTKTQVDRLEKVFHLLTMKPKSKSCEAMKAWWQKGKKPSNKKEKTHFAT